MPRVPAVALHLTASFALLLPLLGQAQEAVRSLATRSEPAVELKVTEDDGVRIEELRVRGQTQRIVVHSKLGGARPYEVVPANGGRDLSQDKRAIGQRVWSVLSF